MNLRNEVTRTIAMALGVTLLTAAHASAQKAVLTPERTLRIEFITTPPFIESNPNVLSAMLGYVTITSPYNTITGSLYDGATLLGTATSTLGAGHTGLYSFHPVPVTWKTANSPYNPFAWSGPNNVPAVVDFTSLHNGTIAGRIDITIDAGRLEIDYRKIGLSTMFATYSNGGSSIPPNPVITSVRLIPELPGDPIPPTYPPDPPPPTDDLDDDDDHVVTTAQLKTACEGSAGNTVTLAYSLRVSNGRAATQQIATGCTLILGSNATIEIDRASITFDGPLTVQSSHKAGLKLDRSMLVAPTVNVNLEGSGSSLTTNASTLRAAGGDLLVAFGDEGKLEASGKFSSAAATLLSGGGTQIRGEGKFNAMFLSASVTASTNVRIDLTGIEGGLKVENSSFSSTSGSVVVEGADANTLIEMKNVDVFFVRDAAIVVNGNQGAIKVTQLDFAPPTGTALAGGVTIGAGVGSASFGTIEASEVKVVKASAFTARASTGGVKGLLKFEKSAVTATGLVLLETGGEGTTEEKDNTLRSQTKIRIASGSGGSCSSGSSLTAPVVEICR